jgi:ATP-binding cassette, subfamily B, bacterial MsbA
MRRLQRHVRRNTLPVLTLLHRTNDLVVSSTTRPTLRQRLARLAPYFRASKAGLFLAFAAAAVAAATEPLLPALLKKVLDDGFGAARNFSLWMVPVAIVGLYIVRGIASFLAQYGLAWAANMGVLQMREAMFARLLDAAPALYAQHNASRLTNTVVYEAQNGAQQLVHSMLVIVRDSLTVTALLGYLLYLNWQLTLFILLLAPAVALVMRVVSKRLHALVQRYQTATDELAYIVEENVLAWRIVRLHGAAANQAARFGERSQRLRSLMVKAVAAGATSSPLTQLIASMALSAVVVLALWQSGTPQGTTVGGFAAFITGMLMLITPVKHLADSLSPLTRGLIALERGLDLIEKAPRETQGAHAPATPVRGDITLRDVSLAYAAEGQPVLQDINLNVQASQTVALVGPSGAGKTTLVNLLPRFLDPTHGQVLIDGIDAKDWNVQALRQQFALVSQDVVLFNDSVAANVSLGQAMDEAKVREALRGAHLLDFVERMPQGLASPIGHNGNQLSGGQRQRLAIARAIYKNAPILILDEATSALDSESERAVQDALDVLMQGRTTIVIAHRLSTIEGADRVVAMDGGRIVEEGPPAQLLAQGGLYARLHALQFKGAVNE